MFEENISQNLPTNRHLRKKNWHIN